jgi:hypothetical protein
MSSSNRSSSFPLLVLNITPVIPSAGEIHLGVYNTLYASGENTASGSTQIDLVGHSGDANGAGTYNDPMTLAVGGSLARSR